MDGCMLLVPTTAAAAATYTRLPDFDTAVYNIINFTSMSEITTR